VTAWPTLIRLRLSGKRSINQRVERFITNRLQGAQETRRAPKFEGGQGAMATALRRVRNKLDEILNARKERDKKQANPDVSCYTPEEMGSIIAQAQGMWKVLFRHCRRDCARAGELYGLEVADIDFARNITHVRRSVWEGHKQSTKSRNANRAIRCSAKLVTMLKII